MDEEMSAVVMMVVEKHTLGKTLCPDCTPQARSTAQGSQPCWDAVSTTTFSVLTDDPVDPKLLGLANVFNLPWHTYGE
jgi:hypothetical protein